MRSMFGQATPSPAAILLREREVAELLGVSLRTVGRLAERGTLDRVRIGGVTRYRRSDVEALAGPTNGNGPDASGTVATTDDAGGGRDEG